MKISVILGHPDQGSFNHARALTVIQTLIELGHMVIFHDLYAERFDPILIQAEIPKGAELAPHDQESV